MSADRPHPDSSTAEPMSDRIAQPRMYTELAHLWTLVSAPSDYADEARHWRNVLYTKLGAGHHELLELGVGGGNNLSHILRPQVPDHGGQHTGGGCAPSKSPLERGFGGVSHQHKNTPRPSGTPLKRGKENATAEQDVIDAATISFRATAVDLSDKMLNNS
ncbi:MAG: hypothetical protein OEV80_08355, partial [candidate division Zixibacteria bacterium]|nr:hypothetical protein [candidate division Zixibacteria bacterium]